VAAFPPISARETVEAPGDLSPEAAAVWSINRTGVERKCRLALESIRNRYGSRPFRPAESMAPEL
jgi:hypothetical protein